MTLQKQWSSLFFAAKLGNIELVQTLLDANAKVDLKDLVSIKIVHVKLSRKFQLSYSVLIFIHQFYHSCNCFLAEWCYCI